MEKSYTRCDATAFALVDFVGQAPDRVLWAWQIDESHREFSLSEASWPDSQLTGAKIAMFTRLYLLARKHIGFYPADFSFSLYIAAGSNGFSSC